MGRLSVGILALTVKNMRKAPQKCIPCILYSDLVLSVITFPKEDGMLFRPLVAFLILLSLSCGDIYRLSESERAKLDPDLQALFETDDPPANRYDVTVRPDGSKEYAIIVRTSEADELRKEGITVGSVFGDVVTVRVTREELRRILSLPTVRAVENSVKSYPH